jgi:hypothetical protein
MIWSMRLRRRWMTSVPARREPPSGVLKTHWYGPRWVAPDVQYEPLDRRDPFAAAQRPPEDHV